MKLRFAAAFAAALAAILFTASQSEADPNLGTIPAHRHYVQTPDGGWVEVGPRVCDNPNLQKAFNQFHNNVHAVSGTGIGPAAPGLHNSNGTSIASAGCAFVPQQ